MAKERSQSHLVEWKGRDSKENDVEGNQIQDNLEESLWKNLQKGVSVCGCCIIIIREGFLFGEST